MLTRAEQQHIASLAQRWVRAALQVPRSKVPLPAVSPKTAQASLRRAKDDFLDALKEAG